LSDADVTHAVKTAMDSFGRIDAAVFGAGRHSEIMQAQEVPPPPAASKDCFDYDPHYTRDFFDIPWAAWRDDYDMMVLAPMRLAKAVLPLMRAARSGSFVAISGIEAGQPRLPFPLGRRGLPCKISSSWLPIATGLKVCASTASHPA
jgi:NAD(P)-dependent dehydrogenase (short-subunit alcohol dehydrogenase family)